MINNKPSGAKKHHESTWSPTNTNCD